MWNSVKLLFISVIIIAGCFKTFAQDGLSAQDEDRFEEGVKVGNFFYDREEYLTAINYYLDASDLVNGKNAVLIEKLADSYWKAREYHTSGDYYRKLVIQYNDQFPYAKLMYAKSLIAQARYVEAKKMLIDYQVLHRTDDQLMEEAELALSSCKFGIEAMQNPTKVKIENAGFVINSKYSETQAGFLTENTIIYNTQVKSIRKNGKKPKLKTINAQHTDTILNNEIYEGILSEKSWSTKKYVYFPVLKGYSIHGTPALSRSNTLLYVTLINDATKQISIYRTEKVAGVWTKLKILDKSINVKGFSSKNVFVQSKGDEDLIYYSSNRPGGKGGFDIWYAKLGFEGDVIESSVLEGEINTNRDEVTPYFDAHESYLYFSSNGKKGLGGMDIYRSLGDVYGGWSRSHNLGYPINSSSDDIAYIYDSGSDKGYFASNRVGGLNELTSYFDIYTVQYKFAEEVIDFAVTIRVFDRQEKTKIKNATIEVLSKKTKESLLKKDSEENEDFNFKLLNDQDYIFEVRCTDYIPMDLTVSVKKMTVVSSAEKLTYFFSNDENSDVINALQTNVYMTKEGGPIETFVNKPKKTPFVEKDKNVEEEKVVAKKAIKTSEPVALKKEQTKQVLAEKSRTAVKGTMSEEEAFKKLSKDYSKKSLEGLKFHIQVGAYKYPRQQVFHFLSEVGSVGEEQHNGLYKYLIGGKNSIDDAKDFQVSIINKGVKDAFIVPYYNSERINMREAYQLLESTYKP